MVVEGVFRVRRAEQADYGTATEVLLRSRHASVPAIPPLVHLDEEVKRHFVGTVMPFAEVWVAEVDDAVSGVLVLNGNWIEQLYVDPDWTNQGLGTALVERAKAERPEALVWPPPNDSRDFQANSSVDEASASSADAVSTPGFESRFA